MNRERRLHLTFSDGVATIALDHPPLNVYDLEMRDQLIEALEAARDWPDLRLLVLTTAIGHFGVGADITEFGSAEHALEARRIRWDRDPWRLLRVMPAPTLAVLRGYALGSGLEMAALCDMCIGTGDIVIGLPEIHLGMLPAAGGTQSVARRVGRDRTVDLVVTGRRVDADGAVRLGIVDRIVDDPERHVAEIATRVATLDPALVRSVIPHLRPDAPTRQSAAAGTRRHPRRPNPNSPHTRKDTP